MFGQKFGNSGDKTIDWNYNPNQGTDLGNPIPNALRDLAGGGRQFNAFKTAGTGLPNDITRGGTGKVAGYVGCLLYTSPSPRD